MDFKGKTSSAIAKPPTSGSVVGLFSITSGVFSSVVDPLSDSSVDSVDSEGSTQPKYPCKISKREDVSVLARAFFGFDPGLRASVGLLSLLDEWPVPINSNPECKKKEEIELKWPG